MARFPDRLPGFYGFNPLRGYDDPAMDDVLAVFMDAIAKKDARMSGVYFDLARFAGIGNRREKRILIATGIRRLGLGPARCTSRCVPPKSTKTPQVEEFWIVSF